MIHRIIVIWHIMFGVAATLFLFLTISNLRLWNPSRYTLGFAGIGIAATNLLGFIYLFRKSDDHERRLIATGLTRNGISLFVLVFSLSGCLFLEYVGLVLKSAMALRNADAKRPGMHSHAKRGNEAVSDWPKLKPSPNMFSGFDYSVMSTLK